MTRRWNGWGDDGTSYEVPDSAREAIESWIGRPGEPPKDATLSQTLERLPDSRLPDSPLYDRGADNRLRHAVGQSFPDWVRIRSGQLLCCPDAVATPKTAAAVVELIAAARDRGALLLPYGGGTSVAGHLHVERSDRPVICCSLEAMADLEELDEHGCVATFGAGTPGPKVEQSLAARGFTLGHYPQSWELSTVGGWVATRSSGQLSRKYGRIEELFVGGRVQTAGGEMVIPPFPASAAGPDLRHTVLGSEGRLGVITRCQLKVSRQPEVETFRGAMMPDPERAMDAVRDMAQQGLDLNMVRLSLPKETRTSLALSGGGVANRALEAYLDLRRLGSKRCLLLYGASGSSAHVRQALAEAGALVSSTYGGVRLGKPVGAHWEKGRFKYPYLRNDLWEAGFAVDTLETAVPWGKAPALIEAVEDALEGTLEGEDERVHAFTHLSHTYPHGTSLYTSYVFRLAQDPEENLERWRLLKTAASDALTTHGGTISHQHGVGVDHKPWLAAEKGEVGMKLLEAAFHRADPERIFDNGNLV